MTLRIERAASLQRLRLSVVAGVVVSLLAAAGFASYVWQHRALSQADVSVLERSEDPPFRFDATAQSEKYAAAARLSAAGDVALPDIRAALAAHSRDAATKYWMVIVLGNMRASAAARGLLASLMADRDVDIYAASFLATGGNARAVALLETAARDHSNPERATEASDLLQQ